MTLVAGKTGRIAGANATVKQGKRVHGYTERIDSLLAPVGSIGGTGAKVALDATYSELVFSFWDNRKYSVKLPKDGKYTSLPLSAVVREVIDKHNEDVSEWCRTHPTIRP